MGDIYFTRFNPPEGWREPRRLACAPAGPNSALDEQGPSYVNGRLFFSRSSPTVAGDLYVSKKRGRMSFGPAWAIASLNDAAANDIQPNVRKDGREIVFSSNRAGRRMSVWSMSAVGEPGVTQLTTGDTNDLWPSVDSEPNPRLFYQALVDSRPDPRLFMTQLGTTTRTDLNTLGGEQPRVSPKADSIVFTAVNENTGKRDVFRMSDRGGVPVNLTNTPDADEFDPAWSGDGLRVAYVSDVNRSKEAPDNFDIYVTDAAGGSAPVRITTNGSWDDSPAWDGSHAIYFGPNRGRGGTFGGGGLRKGPGKPGPIGRCR